MSNLVSELLCPYTASSIRGRRQDLFLGIPDNGERVATTQANHLCSYPGINQGVYQKHRR